MRAQRLQQVQHLGLHRGVERRGRLVEQQDLRLEDQRARDGDALALAARELVRIAEAEAGAEADLVERALDARLGVADAVDRQRLGQHAVDRLARVQRAVGILEHHLHAAAEGLGAGRRQPSAAAPVSRTSPGRARREPADRAQHGRLARARFADDAEALAGRDARTTTSSTATKPS